MFDDVPKVLAFCAVVLCLGAFAAGVLVKWMFFS